MRHFPKASLLFVAVACRAPDPAPVPAGAPAASSTGPAEGAQGAGGAGGAGAPAVTDAEELDGVYLQSHEVMVFTGDDWEPSEVDDCLALRRLGENQLRFELQLIAANAHLCVVDGVASRMKGASEVYEFRPDSGEGSCRLQLVLTGDAIRLGDPEFGCRMEFCGARAGLDGVSFDRVNRRRSPDGCLD